LTYTRKEVQAQLGANRTFSPVVYLRVIRLTIVRQLVIVKMLFVRAYEAKTTPPRVSLMHYLDYLHNHE